MAAKLRLVQPTAGIPVPGRRKTIAYQQWLFPHNAPSLMVVFNTLSASETEFLYLLEKSLPRYVVDFRSVPRFDFGTLSRKQVFERLEDQSIKYLDLHDLVPSIDAPSWDLSAAQAGIAIGFPSAKALTGPVLCLVESAQIPLRRLYDLAGLLPQDKDIGWDIMLLPDQDASFLYETERDSKSSQEKSIFISHANPEDNDFVLWLKSRLERAGYEVWTDLSDLGAGETTWDRIERTIRFSAAKVIVVLSKVAQSKQGVLDEINLAVSVERSRKLEDFVVPIKLDQLPYSDIRANLARKNIINFSRGWSSALVELLDDLRSSGLRGELRDASSKDFSAQLQDDRPSDMGLLRETETLETNWLPIQKIPSRVFLLEMPSRFPSAIFSQFPANLQLFRHRDFLGSFESNMESCWPAGLPRPKRSIAVDTVEFLKDGSGLIQISALEARKRVASVLHKAWKQFAIAKGLSRFEMSGRREIFAFTQNLIEGGRAQFVDHLGIKRERKLVGRSDKRNVGWHLALELVPKLTGTHKYICKLHVLFSDNSGNFISDVAKQHALRRGFCRSWWNDRWRTLMVASMSWLSGGNSVIQLSVGGEEFVTVGSQAITASAPISLLGIEKGRRDASLLPDADEDAEIGSDELDEAFDEVMFLGDESSELTKP